MAQYLAFSQLAGPVFSITSSSYYIAVMEINFHFHGFIEISELEEAMKETKHLGVVGCDWKFYVDPAQDIFCYHNIHKGVKVFEYQITEPLLKEINEANYIAECVAGTTERRFHFYIVLTFY